MNEDTDIYSFLFYIIPRYPYLTDWKQRNPAGHIILPPAGS